MALKIKMDKKGFTMVKTPYEKYKKMILWKNIAKSINDLEENNDLKITTPPDYIYGYIVKRLYKDFKICKK